MKYCSNWQDSLEIMVLCMDLDTVHFLNLKCMITAYDILQLLYIDYSVMDMVGHCTHKQIIHVFLNSSYFQSSL